MEPKKDRDYSIGDKIAFKTSRELRTEALILSSMGYGVAVIGVSGIFDNVLTITAEPERGSDDKMGKMA